MVNYWNFLVGEEKRQECIEYVESTLKELLPNAAALPDIICIDAEKSEDEVVEKLRSKLKDLVKMKTDSAIKDAVNKMIALLQEIQKMLEEVYTGDVKTLQEDIQKLLKAKKKISDDIISLEVLSAAIAYGAAAFGGIPGAAAASALWPLWGNREREQQLKEKQEELQKVYQRLQNHQDDVERTTKKFEQRDREVAQDILNLRDILPRVS